MALVFNANGSLGAGYYATAGNDTENSAVASATIFALAGNDSINGGTGNDAIWGGAGNDTLSGGAGNDVLNGEADNDLLFGQAGNDTLDGGAGNDTLDGGSGNDSLLGGAGNDTYNVDSDLDIVTELANAGIDTVQTSLSSYNLGTSAVNVENLTYTAGGTFTGTGSSGDNTITGGTSSDSLNGAGGNDTLIGGSGNDTLVGGTGADSLDGGAGIDTADYSASASAVTVNLALGTGLGGDAQGDVLTAIETVFGSNQDDTLIGRAAADSLFGGAGNDALQGGGGADTLNGGTGDDRFVFASAAEAAAAANLLGDTGTDTVEIGGANQTLTAFWAIGSGLEGLKFTGTGVHTLNIAGVTSGGYGTMQVSAPSASALSVNFTLIAAAANVTGTAGADTLRGGTLADTLAGGGGNDTLYSSAGVVGDRLLGEGGDDTFIIGAVGSNTTSAELAGLATLDGGAGSDTLVLFNAAGITTSLANVSNIELLAVGFPLSNATLILTASAANAFSGKVANITGYAGSNTYVDASAFAADSQLIVYGTNGLDVAVGGAGNDLFYGNGGFDTLTGGGGNDDFVFASSIQQVNTRMLGGTGLDRLVITDANQAVNLVASSNSGLEQLVLTGGGAHTVNINNISWFTNGQVEIFADNATKLTVSAIGNTLNTLLVHGSGGDDMMSGTSNGDTLIGGAGRDEFFGMGGADVILGGEGDDILHVELTNSLANIISADAGAGMDVLSIEASQFNASALSNFANFELLRLGTAGAGVNVTLLAGADAAFVGSVIKVEFVRGSSLDAFQLSKDMLVTGSSTDRDQIYTGSGNDVLDSGVNNSSYFDILGGGFGNDTYLVRNADDMLQEGAGQGTDTAMVYVNGWTADSEIEFIRLQGNATVVTGGGLGEQIFANAQFGSLLDGSYGNDTLRGGAQADTLLGGEDDDQFWGGEGADSIDGGITLNDETGYDLARFDFATTGVVARLDGGQNFGEAAGDVYVNIDGLFGSAYGDVLVGDNANNVLVGQDGADVLYGLGGNDYMVGGGDGDSLDGGAGADYLDGGAGFDFADYRSATQGVVARLDVAELNTGDAAGDAYAGVEGLFGSAYADVLVGDGNANSLLGGGGDDYLAGLGGNDLLAADVGNDTLDGGAGDDVLDGGSGDDILDGGAGADFLIGGGGFDRVSYFSAATGIIARLDIPKVNTGDAAGDTYTGISGLSGSGFADVLVGDGNANALYGGDGGDYLAGLAGDDQVFGEAGADILDGSAGNDTLDGGSGDDVLDGGTGADSLIGGGGFDMASYFSAAAGVTARLDIAGFNTGEAAGDTYTGISGLSGSGFADVLLGNDGGNWLRGLDGADMLNGLAGGDVLEGGLGDDNLWGGGGADALDGGEGFDVARYDFSGSGVIARLDGFASSGGEAAGDLFNSIEALYGSAFGDFLVGDGGANVLSGLDGNDVLYGAGGNDLLIGNGGADAFVFNIAGFGADVVLDFQTTAAAGAGHDVLDFRGAGLGAFVISQLGAHALITTDQGSVLLMDVNSATLVGSDFLF